MAPVGTPVLTVANDDRSGGGCCGSCAVATVAEHARAAATRRRVLRPSLLIRHLRKGNAQSTSPPAHPRAANTLMCWGWVFGVWELPGFSASSQEGPAATALAEGGQHGQSS